MNQQITLPKIVGRRLCFFVFLLGWFGIPPSFGQHCPHGRIELAKLAAGMQETKDPNVVLDPRPLGTQGDWELSSFRLSTNTNRCSHHP
jgi:hypothetical protein